MHTFQTLKEESGKHTGFRSQFAFDASVAGRGVRYLPADLPNHELQEIDVPSPRRVKVSETSLGPGRPVEAEMSKKMIELNSPRRTVDLTKQTPELFDSFAIEAKRRKGHFPIAIRRTVRGDVEFIVVRFFHSLRDTPSMLAERFPPVRSQGIAAELQLGHVQFGMHQDMIIFRRPML